MIHSRVLVQASLVAFAALSVAAHAETSSTLEIQLPACAPPVAIVHMYPPYTERARVTAINSSTVTLKRDPDGTPIMMLYSAVSAPCKIVRDSGTIILTPQAEVPAP